jgi:GMP reductase
MHIDQDIKLDFNDVLIRPKRSALPSRAGVDIVRKFSFKHSENH